tara:strand:- start:881 stop:1756 length:876 start_codon:yes stop_codon:yes gene_type:complete
MAPHIDMIMKMQSHLSRERNAQLSYEMNSLEFQRRKDAAQKEADFLFKTDEAIEDLSGIIEDTETTPFEKQKLLSLYALDNARLVKNNSMVNDMLKAANASTKADLQGILSLDESTGFELQAAQFGTLDPDRLAEQYGEKPTQKQKSVLQVAQASWKKREAKEKADKLRLEQSRKDKEKADQLSVFKVYIGYLDEIRKEAEGNVEKAREAYKTGDLSKPFDPDNVPVDVEIVDPDNTNKAIRPKTYKELKRAIIDLRGKSIRRLRGVAPTSGSGSGAGGGFPQKDDKEDKE